MNEKELREAVKFLKSNWRGNDDTSKHIQTLISLAESYLSVEGWPEEKLELPANDLDNLEVKGHNDCLHLCKLALLAKCEDLEKVVGDITLGIGERFILDKDCKDGRARPIKYNVKLADYNIGEKEINAIATAVRNHLLGGKG